MTILLKRIYDDPDPADGFRVLVDRLWPRGVSKQRAALDLWDKDVAPTDELRTAFHHDRMAWPEFEATYRAELAANPALAALRTQLADKDTVTLLYSTRDPEHNQAVVLRDLLAGE